MKIIKLPNEGAGAGNAEAKSEHTTTHNSVIALDYRTLAVLIGVMLLSNIIVYRFMNNNSFNRAGTEQYQARGQTVANTSKGLYLLDKAQRYVYDIDKFETKVREVSQNLAIPPEWLMAVMHSESRFDGSVKNHKGSGATGLIQWMPSTAKGFGITVEKLSNLNHVEQLDFVYEYLDKVRQKYGEYESFTDVYLAILYPKAVGEDYCYTMYAEPEKAYAMNSGLDQNDDKRVTVQDIDRFLKKIYPTAYMISKEDRSGQSLMNKIVTSINYFSKKSHR